ncbi:MAG: peptidylprolyl isomerase [Hydrogenophilales bacterium]|nr:peptidylprolyl isomerase [Hydrogenophilales bacterium]
MKPKRTRNIKLALMALLSGALLSAEILAADAPRPVSTPPSAVFAKVGDTTILQQDYDVALAAATRKKFYHGKAPEGGVAALQREVGEALVANALLLREAKRRGLKPDDAAIRQTIQQYEQRYRDSKQWQQTRAQLAPALTKRLQEESLLSKLENLVHNVPPPDVKQIREYYAAHPDKFTEPEQVRLSVILLKVDPSSATTVWEKAHEEAQQLVMQLRGGADFAALARVKSGEASAEKGGDLGYLHRGMLPEAAQKTVDKLKPGDTADPVRLLEGVAIFRLNERKSPKLNDFEAVKERGRDLWLREQGEIAWNALIARLKKETPVRVDESRYLPLSTAAGAPAVKK